MWNLPMQKQMLKLRFERLIINRKMEIFHNLKYFPQVMELYIKYLKYLEDDFSIFSESLLLGIVQFIESTSSHFYLVLLDDKVCGFFALEHFIGSNKKLYSAEVVTCFDRNFWGSFTKLAAKSFKEFCFVKLGLMKLKALIYPQNSRVIALLRSCGFKKEGCLKAETIKNNRLQDIEVYSVFNESALQNAYNKEELCN